MVLIPEVAPAKFRHRILQNQRGLIVAGLLRSRSDVTVARMPFRLLRD